MKKFKSFRARLAQKIYKSSVKIIDGTIHVDGTTFIAENTDFRYYPPKIKGTQVGWSKSSDKVRAKTKPLSKLAKRKENK